MDENIAEKLLGCITLLDQRIDCLWIALSTLYPESQVLKKAAEEIENKRKDGLN